MSGSSSSSQKKPAAAAAAAGGGDGDGVVRDARGRSGRDLLPEKWVAPEGADYDPTQWPGEPPVGSDAGRRFPGGDRGRRAMGVLYSLCSMFMFYVGTIFLLVPAAIVLVPLSLDAWRYYIDEIIGVRTYYYLNGWTQGVFGSRYRLWVADPAKPNAAAPDASHSTAEERALRAAAGMAIVEGKEEVDDRHTDEGDPHSSDALVAAFHKETSSGLLVMNHRTRLDWAFGWVLMERWGCVKHLRIALKDMIAKVPGPGWATQFFGFLFLRRDWDSDSKHMSNHLDHLLETNGGYPVQLLIFPEGTDLTPHTRSNSIRWAKKSKTAERTFVLSPRVAGFALAQSVLRRKTSACWVVTVAYSHYIPQDESALLTGRFPPSVDYYFQSYPWSEVPEDSAGAGAWITERFAEMDARLEAFYTAAATDPNHDGSFRGAHVVPPHPTPWHGSNLFGIASWLGIIGYFGYLACTTRWAFWWFIIGNIICLIMTHGLGGWDKIELRLWHNDLFAPGQAAPKRD